MSATTRSGLTEVDRHEAMVAEPPSIRVPIYLTSRVDRHRAADSPAICIFIVIILNLDRYEAVPNRLTNHCVCPSNLSKRIVVKRELALVLSILLTIRDLDRYEKHFYTSDPSLYNRFESNFMTLGADRHKA